MANPPATGILCPCNLRRWSGLSVSPHRPATARTSGVSRLLNPRLRANRARSVGMGIPFARGGGGRPATLGRLGSDKEGPAHGGCQFFNEIVRGRRFGFGVFIGERSDHVKLVKYRLAGKGDARLCGSLPLTGPRPRPVDAHGGGNHIGGFLEGGN